MRREEKKLPVCTWQDQLYIKCQGIYKKKKNLLKIIKKFQVQQTKINCISCAKKQAEKVIKNTTAFIVTQKMESLGIHVTNHAEDLGAENDKILMKETKDLTHGGTYHVHGLEASTQ